jgi:hypothetical protein
MATNHFDTIVISERQRSSVIIHDDISVSANEWTAAAELVFCFKTNLYALFMIDHNCLLLITSASRYRYPLPPNSLVYLYWIKHWMYHGSPDYVTCHAYLLTDAVKNTFTRHSSTGTQTEKQSKPGSNEVWCSQVACIWGDLRAHSMTDKDQGMYRASKMKQAPYSLEKAEWKPRHNAINIKLLH